MVFLICDRRYIVSLQTVCLALSIDHTHCEDIKKQYVQDRMDQWTCNDHVRSQDEDHIQALPFTLWLWQSLQACSELKDKSHEPHGRLIPHCHVDNTGLCASFLAQSTVRRKDQICWTVRENKPKGSKALLLPFILYKELNVIFCNVQWVK